MNFHLLLAFLGEPEELIKHGLRALRETLPSEQELNTKVNHKHCYENEISIIIFVPIIRQ